MTKGLEIRFLSSTYELLGIVSDNTNYGSILDLKVSETVNGGVTEFTFTLSRDFPIPIARNTNCLFLVDGIRWFAGYIDVLPEADQNDPAFEIKGLGYFNRLEKVLVSKSYTSQTLLYIVQDVLSTYLGASVGVFYDASKINPPTLTGITIEFNDMALSEVLSYLVQVSNYDFTNSKYRYYVDDTRDLVLTSYGDSVIQTLFEGYQYQSPVVSSSDENLINSLVCYRADAVDSDTLEYVTTVQDTQSMSNNGKYEESLTFPSSIDTATITKIANAKIQMHAEKEKLIELDLAITEPKQFGVYNVSNRRKNYWQEVDSLDDLNNWNSSTLVNGTAILSDEHVLTGRRGIELQFNSSTTGYIFKDLDVKVPLPSIIRAFAYVGAVGVDVEIKFYDSFGSFTSIDIPLEVTSQWVQVTKEIPIATDDDVISVNYSVATEDDLIVNYDILTEDTLDAKIEADATIRDVSRVEIHVTGSGAGSIWFDNLGCLANTFRTNSLLLASVDYEVSTTRKEAFCSFGDRPPSLIDAIRDKVERGSLALSVLTKR